MEFLRYFFNVFLLPSTRVYVRECVCVREQWTYIVYGGNVVNVNYFCVDKFKRAPVFIHLHVHVFYEVFMCKCLCGCLFMFAHTSMRIYFSLCPKFMGKSQAKDCMNVWMQLLCELCCQPCLPRVCLWECYE